jgi:RND family efflux transporter MFP subunit
VIVVLAAGAGAGAGWWLTRPDTSAGPAVPVAVAADRGPVTLDVSATGTVRAATTRGLSFTADGTVETVTVQAGAKVKAGDALATIDDTGAAAAVSDAQSNLDDAEDQLAAAKVPASATPAPAAAAAAPAVVDPAVVDPGGSGSDGTDAIFGAQERVNQARATLKEARIALAGTAIRAPMAGTVMSVAGQVGSPVGKGSAFITLADTYAMQVGAAFPEADAGTLAVGQRASVTLADRVSEEFPAKVVQVDPVGTAGGTLVTYGVLLSFTAAPSGLLVGQTAAVAVRTREVVDTLRVPSTAVHDVANGSGIVLVGRGDSASRRTVRVGLRGDRYIQISSGVSAGETVIRSW